MGLIRAATGALGGTLADSWLEYITAGPMDNETIMTRGTFVSRKKHGSNRKGSPDIISNGSRIEVGPNQMMILVESGRILDYTAEEGCYEVYLSTSPSMFNGELNESVQESFERFRFGGVPGKSQKVYFINLQEIRGIKFGTRNPLQYFDNFYNAELFLRCHGSYSIKIIDPIKFFMEVAGRSDNIVTIADLGAQFQAEFLTALQSAIGQMAEDGVRISSLPSKSGELSQYMSTALDDNWGEMRGINIQSVGIASISYDDESKKLINLRNQGAMMSDPTIREGYVQSSIAHGLENAGSTGGGAYMAMGVGMQGAGNFAATASATNAAQMQQNQQTTTGWTCSCGAVNTRGNFCTSCGKPKPAATNGWTCSCGTVNTGKFCTECGKPKPDDTTWTCTCGTVNKSKFCTECGKPRP